MANSLPLLSGLDLFVTLDEEAVNLAPQLIDTDVTFVDADNNFDGGTLVLSDLAAGDILAIRNEGTGAGEIGLSGSDVTYEGTVIGTFTGGSDGVALSVIFNAQATSASIEALIENLTYQNLSDTPVFARTLELTITDAAGAQAVTPVVMQEATGAANPFNGIDVGTFSAPGFADLDGDGDLDAVIGKFNGTLNYFENTGTGVAPVYVERTGAANPFDGIDVGDRGTPSIVDLDGDGDLDAVIGGNVGNLVYFENTGTGVAPAYVARTGAANPVSIDVGFFSAPSIADLDGDGDLDAVIGEYAGNLYYYENTGTGVAPAYVERTGAANPFNGIDVGSYSPSSFADLDGDGDLDAVSGENLGTLKYFENTGTGVAPVYVERTGAANPFNGIDVGNKSTPSFADLDGDGDLDAVVGEQDGVLNYYENTRLRSTPGDAEFAGRTGGANPFNGVDVGSFSTPSFADLDSDGDPDAVIGESLGTLNYFENTGTGAAPVYVERTDAANPFDGMGAGVYSTPSFADLDGDGDLDAVVGELGGTVNYFKNNGTGAAPVFVAQTGAANPFNSINIGSYGATAIAIADLDGDGDLDAVVGELGGTLKYFENTGTGVAPVYVEQTGADNPFDGIDVGYESKPRFADLDGDGDLDTVIGERYGTLDYFENTGIGVAPAFILRTGAANPFDGIDVGSSGTPGFTDLDGDGDLDAVIGEQYGTLNYFENTGIGVAPAYVLRTGAADPFNGMDVGSRSAPSFADLDGDGDLDAVIGANDGTLKYFENTGTGVAPANVERTGAANPFNGIDVGSRSTPNFADLDGDGDLDAVIGKNDGNLNYFENTGTSVAPAYVERTGAANPFNGIDVGYNSTPSFADLDGDGDLDTVIGANDGTLRYFENTGTGVAPAYDERTGAANPFNGMDVGDYSKPSFADLDGDGDLDAVIGEFYGTQKYFENTGTGAAPAYVEGTGAANPFDGIDVGDFNALSFADLDGDVDLDAVIGEFDGNLNYYENTGPGGFKFVLKVTQHADPSAGDDLMNGTDGADTIDALGGNDSLIGGAGNDSLVGGADNDSLMGGFGADNALGNAGIDTLIGNAGNDTLDGGSEADLIYGSTNDDSILGSAGIDTLVGNAGNDTINGGTEDDQVFGSVGDDYVLGGLGADVVQGNAGNDTVIGGDGTGTDTLDGNDSLDGGGGDDSLFGGFGADLELGNTGIDTLIGNAGNDTLDGGADGDLVYGSAGDDSILGGAGIDTLVGNANNDTLDGGADDDQIFGSIGDDVVAGGAGNDVVSGNAGNDTVVGGAGNDTMQGNNDTDTFRYDATSLNTGDVAANQADFVSATAAGDLISMLGLNDELTINGTALSALTANALVGNALNASNNIAFTGGVLQIDLDGNDVFNALNDFQVQLTGVTTVTYNATSDLFQLS